MSDKSNSSTRLDANMTLEQIERDDWGEPTFDSHLVRECRRLRRVPLVALTVEDLRLMIGQQIGLVALAPLALVKLEDNPLAEGDHYPGDLLNAVVQLPKDFWNGHPELRRRLGAVIERAQQWAASADAEQAELVTRVSRDAASKGLTLPSEER